MPDLQEYVDQCVAELSGPNAFRAWHSLIEAGPSALPLVLEAYNTCADANIRVSLVHLVSEYRSPSAVPFLTASLSDRKTEIWKAALEGLVILGGHAALDALREFRITASRDQRPWIDEAIQQIADGWH